MTKIFGPNWKTTLAGIIAGAGLIVYKIITHQPITSTDVTAAAGLIGIGSFAKDRNVTGGTVTQPTVANPPTLIAKDSLNSQSK